MDACQLVQTVFDAAMHAGDEFELAFAEIGGDARVRQRRAQRGRVRRQRQGTGRQGTQAFLLDTAKHAAQAGSAQRAQSKGQGHGHGSGRQGQGCEG